MPITKSLRENIRYYGITLPIDKRTKEYKEIIRIKNINEKTYVELLRKLVKQEREKEKKKVKRIEKETKGQIERLEAQKKNLENEKRKKVIRPIQIKAIRNKLFYMKPTQSAWKSYFLYVIENTRENLIHNFYNYENPFPAISSQDILLFIKFYKLQEYFMKFFNHKVWFSFEFLEEVTETSRSNGEKRTTTETRPNHLRSKSKLILSKNDIDELILDYLKEFDNLSSRAYINILGINKLDVNIAKVQTLNGKSYKELPDFIKNKKAIINIKNEDNKCFLYSVLCGLITPASHPERVSHYKDRLNELSYKDEEFENGMSVHKIRFFEKRNNLKINVYSLEDEKSIIPVYVSCNEAKDLPLIQLFYYDNHYSYVNNFNRLMGENGTNKLVCPYCCQFKSSGGNAKEALEKHLTYCISGQKVVMPKSKSCIEFKNFNHINECPVRIYADFEAINDNSIGFMSKNGKSNFRTGHIGASFKILVVSDIPIEGYTKVSSFYTYEIIYKGLDSNKIFINKLEELEKSLIQVIQDAQYKNKFNMIINREQQEEFKKCTSCWICKSSFSKENCKVRHHNHNTGLYHSTICNNCNIQIKDTIKIPVLFHNLNYDKNIFFKSLVYYKEIKEVSVLPDNSQNFKSFSVGKLHFIDTFKFMSSSLEKLISNLPENNSPFLKHLSNGDDFKYKKFLKQKGYFPYDWFNDIEKFKLPIEKLNKDDFDNIMTSSKLNNDEWDYIQELIKYNNIKTFEDFHDFYLNIDVNGLADVFENFRQTSIKYYKLEPCNYVGTPSFAWNAMLLKSNVKLENLNDIDMYLFFENGIRGGQSVIFNKHSKANNKYLDDYNPDEENKYIIYLDANNLYGEAMSHKLPISGFEWFPVDLMTEEMIKNYSDANEVGYVLEVDLNYPEHLHNKHNDYPLAPERFNNKLCGTFYDKKNYVVHIKNLKFYLEHGLEITKIHRVVKFNQSSWLNDWIQLNTDFRTKATNEFEKDYFKLMNNAVFGKTMENVRDRVEIKCAFDEDYFKKYTTKPTFKYSSKFGDGEKYFMIMEMGKKVVELNKPIYAGFTILDFSKLHMYKFHYDVMKEKYDNDIKLLMTDTDSLVYEVKTNDIYEDINSMSDYFDMSEYPKESKFYNGKNKKVIGKFKDEVSNDFIKEFIGIRSKTYAFIKNNNEISKKLKGVSKSVVKKDIKFDDYKRCIFENKEKIVSVHSIRSKDLSNYSLEQSKVALRNTDDKRCWVNATQSLAWGHSALKCLS